MKKKLWTLVIVAAIGYFVYTIIIQQMSLEEQKLHYAEIQSNIENEKIKNEQLLQQKSKISTDEFVEKIAREKLGYVKDGEKIYVDINK